MGLAVIEPEQRVEATIPADIYQRRRIFRINTKFFPTLFASGVKCYDVTEEPLPADATIVSVRLSFDLHNVEFLLQSAEFSPVGDGEAIPEIEPRMREYVNHFTAKME